MNYSNVVLQQQLLEQQEREDEQRQLSQPHHVTEKKQNEVVAPTTEHHRETLVPGHTAKSSIRRHPEPDTVGERYERKMLEKGIEPTATTSSHRAEALVSEAPLAPEKFGEKVQRNLGIKSEEQILDQRAHRGEVQEEARAQVRGEEIARPTVRGELASETGRTTASTVPGTGRAIVDVGEKSHVHLPPTTTAEKIQKTLGIKTEEEILLQRAQRKEQQEEARELEREGQREIRGEGRVVRDEELDLPKETIGQKIQKTIGLKSPDEILAERATKASHEQSLRDPITEQGEKRRFGIPETERDVHPSVGQTRYHKAVGVEVLPKETIGEKIQRKTGIKTEDEILAERKEKAMREHPHVEHEHEHVRGIHEPLPKETIGEKLQRKTGIKTDEEILAERRERAAEQAHGREFTKEIHEPGYVHTGNVLPKETAGEKLQRKTGIKTEGEILDERREREEREHVIPTTGVHEPGYVHTGNVLPKETVGEKIQRKTGMKSEEEVLEDRRERADPHEHVIPTTGVHVPLSKETVGEKIQRKTGMKSEAEILEERRAREIEREEAEGVYGGVHESGNVREVHTGNVLPKETLGEKFQRKSKLKSEEEILAERRERDRERGIEGEVDRGTEAEKRSKAKRFKAIHVTGPTTATATTTGLTTARTVEEPVVAREKAREVGPVTGRTTKVTQPLFTTVTPPTTPTEQRPAEFGENVVGLEEQPVHFVTPTSSHPSSHPTSLTTSHPTSLPSAKNENVELLVDPEFAESVQHVSTSVHPSSYSLPPYSSSAHYPASSSSSYRHPSHSSYRRSDIDVELLLDADLQNAIDVEAYDIHGHRVKKYDMEIPSEPEIPKIKQISGEQEGSHVTRKSEEILHESEIPETLRKSKEISTEREIPKVHRKYKEIPRESERQYEKRLEREAERHLGRRLEQETEQQEERQQERQQARQGARQEVGRETEREIEREKEREKERESERKADRKEEREAERQAEREAERKVERETERESERQEATRPVEIPGKRESRRSRSEEKITRKRLKEQQEEEEQEQQEREQQRQQQEQQQKQQTRKQKEGLKKVKPISFKTQEGEQFEHK